MFDTGNAILDDVLSSIPRDYRGPGGAFAVLKDGEVIARHAWGYADLERHIPMTTKTLMPMCSISKEFTCSAMLEALDDPAVLDAAVRRYLPLLEGPMPRAVDLANNQSGLRDYWALTVLSGASPQGECRAEDGKHLLSLARTTHFDPGSQYSYANGNFRILSDLIAVHTGRPLGDWVKERIFGPAGMKTAEWCEESSEFPGDAVGYEGSMATGHFPAINKIHLSGDSGVNASLEDMIAWEQFVDATREDENSIYRRISARTTYSDGKPACYSFGLRHMDFGGVAMTGHGGALRGWRLQRRYSPAERLSVVVMFNHEISAPEVADKITAAALGVKATAMTDLVVDLSWCGHYFDETDTKLSLTVSIAGPGRIKARFGTAADILEVVDETTASSRLTTLTRTVGGMRLERGDENLLIDMVRIGGHAKKDVAGRYYSDELGAELVCEDAGGEHYVAFEGFLGKGAMQPIYPIGSDVWIMPNERAMDSAAPGDWTVVFDRDDDGVVKQVTVGCWLARKVIFVRRQS